MLQMFNNNNRALRSIQKNVQNKHKGEKREVGGEKLLLRVQ